MGQILAIDYGKKKIGLAMSDETKQISGKLPLLRVNSDKEAVEGIMNIIESFGTIDKIILGLPLGRDLKPTQMSVIIKKFAEKLQKELGEKINIVFTNETYSTNLAERGKNKNFKKDKSDSEAARIFLQEYLDHMNLQKKKL